MKKTISIVLLLMINGNLILLQGCKKDDPLPETERVKNLLKANTWRMQTVTVDGIDQTLVYAGLTLTFTDTNYSTANGGAVWPATGTWTFADQTGKLITRSDGLPVSIEEATTTKLSLKLTWAKTTLGGRASSIAGVHVFVFGK